MGSVPFSFMRETVWYSHFAKVASRFCGRPKVFVFAVALIAAWAISGPLFGFSDVAHRFTELLLFARRQRLFKEGGCWIGDF